MSEKKNRKGKGKTYLAPRREKPTQPSRPTRGSRVFFPTPRLQAARWNATEPAVDATSTPSSFQASPWPLLAPGDALEHATSIPPLHELPPLLSRPIRHRLRRTPEHRRA